jgi:adenylate cyclase
MEDRKSPPPEHAVGEARAGWRRKWPIVTLFSAVGIACLVGAIAWAYTVHYRKFPPDVADRAAFAWPLPDIPSAVVLPIAAITLTDRDTLLAGRFSDDLIAVLSRVPGLFVISPETSSRFGGGQFRIKSTAEMLGVRYLVTGTLTRSGRRYRVFLRVIDAFSGETEWVEDYDAEPDHLFKVQGRALPEILDAMDIDLEDAEIARLSSLGPSKSKAWIAYAEAVAYRVASDRESMSNSLARLLKAHTEDPKWAGPTREIAWSYLNAARRGWTDADLPTVPDLARTGIDYADALMASDPDDPHGPARKAALLELIEGDTEESLALWREAARLGPNIFAIQWERAQVLVRADRHADALAVMRRALRVHPRHPVALTQALAELQYAAGRPEAAFASLDAVIEKRPAAADPMLMRIFVLATLKRTAEAEARAKAFLSLHTDFSFSKWSARQGRRGRPPRLEWRDALIGVGIPD